MSKSASLFILLITSINIYGQSGEWIWMSGDSVPSQTAYYGVQGVSSPLNKPRSTYEGTDWKDFQGNFWLYDHSDMWSFNPTTLEWTWIKGTQGASSFPNYGIQGIPSSSNHPGWRFYCSASWVDNNGMFWLYGGSSLNGSKCDLWKFNPTTYEWTWVNGDTLPFKPPFYGTKGVSSPLTNPGAKTETNAAWVDSNNNLWLFGGDSPNGSNPAVVVNTLWKFDITLSQWTWISGDSIPNTVGIYGIKGISNSNNKPGSRMVYSKWIENDNLWFFGGMNGSSSYNDLWKYSIVTNEWTWMSGPDTANSEGFYSIQCDTCVNCVPRARTESRACWKDYNGNFWLYGGKTIPHNINDLWVYNPQVNTWTWVYGDSIPSQTIPNYGIYQVSNPLNNPGVRNGSASWLDGFNNLWLFGGYVGFGGNAFNDLWKYEADTNCNGLVSNIQEFSRDNKIQIYPNPFTESVTIKLEISNESNVAVLILNIQGQVISKLTNVIKPPGLYTIDFMPKALKLNKGIYVIEVRINNQLYSRKVSKVN